MVIHINIDNIDIYNYMTDINMVQSNYI